MTAEKKGRPLLLGELDGMVQTYIQSTSNRGAVVTRSKVATTAKRLMIHYGGIVGKVDLDSSE